MFGRQSTIILSLLCFTTSIIPGNGLKCFQCSQSERISCPSTTIGITDWATDSNYMSVGPQTDNSCVIGFSKDTNVVYYQSGISTKTCTSPDFQKIIIIKVNQIATVANSTGGSVFCCNQDGCNWNSTSAQNNQNYATLSGKWYVLPDIVNWTPIIIAIVIFVLIVICCCGLCCFFCFKKLDKRNKKKKKTPKVIAPLPKDPYRGQMVITPTPIPIGVKSRGPPDQFTPQKKNVQFHDPQRSRKNSPPRDAAPPKKTSKGSEKKYTIPLDKDQSDWEEIWKNANNPNFKGPLSPNKKYLK